VQAKACAADRFHISHLYQGLAPPLRPAAQVDCENDSGPAQLDTSALTQYFVSALAL
jgi:hypothetical protein